MIAPKFQRRSEDRPREICNAALELFAERGFAATRVEDIAARAGISKGTLYLYFKDKQEIFGAVVRNTVAPNIAMIRDSITAVDMPFSLMVYTLLERFIDIAEQLPIGAVAKIVIGESRNFPELARVYHDLVITEAIGAIAELVGTAQAKGEVRPGDARLFAMTLIGPMLMGILWRETFEPVGAATINLKALARQHAAASLTGLLTEQVR
ncbi:MAG: TetR/AcrR family transcriptional regulator [Sphingomicrobium sp.]|jgi:AcrR family transcriptional regulator